MDITVQFGKLTFTFEIAPNFFPFFPEIYRQVGIPISLSSNFDIAINGIKLDDSHSTLEMLGITSRDTISITRHSKEAFPAMRLPHAEATDEEITALKATKDWSNEEFVAFMGAARTGDNDLIQKLLKAHTGTNRMPVTIDGITPLMVAARFGQVAVIQTLLENGADVMKQGKDGRNALIIAIQYDRNKAATTLFESNFDASSATDHNLWTALMWATWKEQVDLITLFLKHTAPLKLQHTDICKDAAILAVKLFPENTVLLDLFFSKLSFLFMNDVAEVAAQHGRIKLIKHIFSKHLDFTSPSYMINSSFISAKQAARFNQIPILEWLLSAATEEQLEFMYDEYKYKSEHKGTLLKTPARHNKPEAIITLLKYVPKKAFASDSWNSETVLMVAAKFCTSETAITALLKAGCDPSARSFPERTPLVLAAQFGNMAALSVLLDKEKNIDNINAGLLSAIKHSQLEAINLLLAKGADANKAFICAVKLGKLAAINLLIAKGVDVNVIHHVLNWSVLMEAILDKHTEVVTTLLQAHADINYETEKGGATALTVAAALNKDPVILKRLMKGDKDPTLRRTFDCDDSATPLEWAISYQNVVCVDIFLLHEPRCRDNIKKNIYEIASLFKQYDEYRPLIFRLSEYGLSTVKLDNILKSVYPPKEISSYIAQYDFTHLEAFAWHDHKNLILRLYEANKNGQQFALKILNIIISHLTGFMDEEIDLLLPKVELYSTVIAINKKYEPDLTASGHKKAKEGYLKEAEATILAQPEKLLPRARKLFSEQSTANYRLIFNSKKPTDTQKKILDMGKSPQPKAPDSEYTPAQGMKK